MGTRKERHYRIINGQLYARFSYTDSSGRRKERHLKANSKTEARELYERMKRELGDHGEKVLDAQRMTFQELADHYTASHLVQAEYVDDRKVSGRRSLRGLNAQMKALTGFFGQKRLRNISYGDIALYRSKSLKTPTVRGQRSIATVNRELSLLRNMFNVAMQEGWILRNPFSGGKPLINAADEHKRERILSREEEQLLLSACTGRRAHLRPIIICALDTGMRQGEIFKLKWQDVDLDSRLIRIQSTYTKTLKARTVPITQRLAAELGALLYVAPDDPSVSVFGIQSNVKNSFETVRRVTGLQDLRFHDLRHTAGTRLVQGGLPLAEVARILGHQQLNTTYRYTNADNSTMERASAILDAYQEEEPKSPTLLN